MSSREPRAYSECVVVAAPTQRDGDVTRRLLEAAKIECHIEHEVAGVVKVLGHGIGALLITDLTLASPDMPLLVKALERQPAWSGLPVVVMCREAGQSAAVLHLMHSLANVTTLDRPASTRTLVSALRAALRSRRAQYLIRDQISELQRAKMALRSADRRKDEFLATLAHELRNPLAPLKNGITLLTRAAAGDPQLAKLHAMMDRQVNQLVQLIDELLDVSRIATGKIVLHRTALDLREVVQVALEGCEPQLASAHHEVVVALPPQSLPVSGDAARLGQIVTNLVSNAAKYTPPGGRIEVSLREEAGEAVLTVADNGLGIPASMLGAVFDMFTQVNQTLDRSQGGLGIGLSLVKRLIALHGGSVTAHSDGPDRGSTFTVRLPRLPDDGPLAAPEPADGADPPASQVRRLQVLVIDDNVDAADSLAMLLRSLGHHAEVAYDGEGGLAAAVERNPQAIFCDLGMPSLDGLAVAARLRGQGVQSTLVAVTGWGAEADKRRSRAAGFDHHLTKPADVSAVKAILRGL